MSDRTRLQDSSKREVAALLARETTPLPLPRSWSLDAFVWQDRGAPGSGDGAAACAALVARRGPS